MLTAHDVLSGVFACAGVDPEICRAVVREFLYACQRHMPLLAKQSMDAGMKMGMSMGAGALDPSMMKQMEAGMYTRVLTLDALNLENPKFGTRDPKMPGTTCLV